MKLNPYIMYSGNAEEALNFYKKCLKGEIKDLGRYGDSTMESSEELKDKIMHARFIFDDNIIMVSDSHVANETTPGSNIQLSVDVPGADELESVFTQMSAGGKITMPLQDMFWGARFGMLTDKFGVKWMFNHELKK
ncbi:MAG: VOC family protein [Chitinophagaceae bacterium]